MTPHLRRLPAVLAVAVFALVVRPGGADDNAPPKPPPPAGKAEITDLLAKRVDVEKFDGKFGDALTRLREKYDLPLVVDTSIKPEDDVRVEDRPVKLPKLTSVRLDSVLRLVCEQADTMFLVQPDSIKIVIPAFALYESGVMKQPDPRFADTEEPMLSALDMQKARPLTQRGLVTAVFKGKPLAEILGEIAGSTGANVVLAPQTTEAAKLPLTVRFANTPVEAAVRTLCEMTDLGVIEDANVLLVTTKERADAKAKAVAAKRPAAHPASGMVGYGGGWAGGGPGFQPAPADVTGELAKLKEQNEQLKKQLDEIQKLQKK